MYMLCSHTPVTQLATNISYFFSDINYFIITHTTDITTLCGVYAVFFCFLQYQAENIYKIFSKQFFAPLWNFGPNLGPGLPLWDFTITLTEYTTLSRTPLIE